MDFARLFEHSPPPVTQLHSGISGFPRARPGAKGWDEFRPIWK
jgi:hypothetical protein